MKKLRYSKTAMLLMINALWLIACGGGDNGTETPEPTPTPGIATLVLPANNEICYDGQIVSEALSEVIFEWEASENTASYQILIKNLNTQKETTYSESQTSREISLERSTPYSWKIISLSEDQSKQTTSATWKFYLSGTGTENYAPFPADLISPKSGQTINPDGGSYTFEWTVSDPDSQILTTTLYLDTTDGKSTAIASELTEETYTVENLESNTRYFWSIVTRDPEGNSSRSAIRDFRTE
ncbi:hypothetical protein [Robertkochia solimangrovi]|uniref:hypothetical protein n=1 Tax=Robertkochia solimangrovi TaxID=2213046 RepID=UPI00117C59B8|nr:hypothetical protein [Robertkochia solimangrovi]TRZ43302.1 hypothetical protein DMZ48_11510 [Robertkochia solimangrovi]